MKYFLIGIDGAQEELFFRFNLPAANIAPKVNGFFVSGGGVKLRNLSLEYLNRSQKMINFLFNFSS